MSNSEEKSNNCMEVVEMSKIYDSIIRGLQEAIDDAKGKRKLQKRTVTVIPLNYPN